MKMSGRLVFFSALVLTVIFSSLVTYKIFFVGIDVEDPEVLFAKPPFPTDDESLYLATIAFSRDRDRIQGADWFENIRENLDGLDLLHKYGYGGYKIYYVYTTHHYLGLRFVVPQISKVFSVPLDDAYRFFAVAFPFTLLLKYILLYLLFFRRNLFAMVVVFIADLALARFEPANCGGGMMGLIFTSSALAVRLFWDDRRRKAVSYGLAALGAVVAFQTIIVFACFVFVELLTWIRKKEFRPVETLVSFFMEHYLFTLVGIYLSLNLFSFGLFSYQVSEEREYYVLWQHFLRMGLVYFWSPLSLAAVLGFGVLVHTLVDDARRETDAVLMVLASVLACYGVLILALGGDITYLAGIGRSTYYAQEISILGAALLLKKSKAGPAIPWKKWVVAGSVILFVGIQLPVLYKKIQPEIITDRAVWHPEKAMGRDGSVFYIARGAEPFYRYLWQGLYNSGPLVIDIPNRAYQARARRLGMDITIGNDNGKSR
jgi:hypothetical protein